MVQIASPVPAYTHSLRVSISLTSEKLNLSKVIRVWMRAAAPPPAPPTENSSGYWFEVRAKNGTLLYYRPLPLGDVESIEVFDDPQGGTIRRVPSSEPERKLELVIPDLPDAAEFTVHGPNTRADRGKASSVLFRVPMEHLRALASGKTAADGGPSHQRGGVK